MDPFEITDEIIKFNEEKVQTEEIVTFLYSSLNEKEQNILASRRAVISKKFHNAGINAVVNPLIANNLFGGSLAIYFRIITDDSVNTITSMYGLEDYIQIIQERLNG